MAIHTKIILIIFLSCFLSSGICARETLNKTPTGSGLMEFTLPEIVVKGDKSLIALKMDVIRSEELKYEIFNNLNSTDDFDITCEWRAPTGTRIKYWGCEVGYIKKAQEREAFDFLNGLTPFPRSAATLAAENADKTRALNKEMRALAVMYPELALAMINAHEMQQFYLEERYKRFKNSMFTRPSKPDLLLNKFVVWEAAFQDHQNGRISDEIWGRWDSIYKKIFRYEIYQNLWKSTNTDKYGNAFVAYVNGIVSGK